MINLQKYEDTIVAIATAFYPSAIAVIRISGSGVFNIIDKIFRTHTKREFRNLKGFNAIYGEIIDNHDVIDEVVITKYVSPRSYTGEDMVEISCHGSLYIQQRILNLVIKHGARLADPGEFTLRAFLNGKLDLSQAEAVADLISANSEAARKLAFNQLKGSFSNELKNLKQKLIDFASLIELELDFAEEDVEFANREQLHSLIEQIISKITSLVNSFEYGNAVKNGIPVAIVGEPNVGKSTLLNVLIKEDKAIVSDIPGTTRDAIEDVISINGILFRFIDTAGIRETQDHIETLGIERTKEKIRKSYVIIVMIDVQKPETALIMNKIKPLIADKKVIIALNKIDRPHQEIKFDFQAGKVIEISAKHKKNISQLEKALLEAIDFKKYSGYQVVLTNSRHYEALKRTLDALIRAKQGIEHKISQEFIAQDIREAIHYLGEITGEITTDDILHNIFSNFCIGK